MVGFIIVTIFFTLRVLTLFRPAVDVPKVKSSQTTADAAAPQAAPRAAARMEFDTSELETSSNPSFGDET
jgi:hypothetical protein